MIIGFFVLNIFDIMYLELYSPDATFQAGAFNFFITSKPFKEKTELKKISFFFHNISLFFSTLQT